MPEDRMTVAMRVALQGVENATPKSVPAKYAQRQACSQMVLWVLLGGKANRPPAEQWTDFVCQTAGEAIEAGFARAYGDAHRDKIQPSVITRLASIGF